MDSRHHEREPALLPSGEEGTAEPWRVEPEVVQDSSEPGDLDSLSIYFREIGPKDRAISGPPCCAGAAAGRAANRAFRCLGPDAPGAGRCVLVVGHLRLVAALARRYRHLNLPLEDLIQEGNLGLVAAARGFDPKRHGRFSNHAARYIRQAICRALSEARTIRIPQRPLALRRRAASVEAELEQRYGNDECRGGRRRRHRIEDDAAEIGVDPDELRETVRLVPEVESEPVRNSVCEDSVM